MFSGYSVDIGQNKLSTLSFNDKCLFQKIYIFKIHKIKISKIMSMRSGILS